MDVCDEPEAPGECGNWELKWIFDKSAGRCRQFYYGGCGGNGNRFETESQCEQRCAPQEAAPPAPQPEEPEQQPERRPAQETQSQPRPRPAVSGSVCDLPTSMGDCDQWKLKWSYNATAGICHQFYYGGCGGNENRFETEEDCSARCLDGEEQPAEPDTSKCYRPAEAGNCYERTSRWYYNHQEGHCDEFIYTGCGGNDNNFASEEECQNACDAVADTCALPPIAGNCNDISTRWYFDRSSGRCSEFEFTGCRGNRNNFVSERLCLDFCGRQEQVAQQPEQPQESQEPQEPEQPQEAVPVSRLGMDC